MSRRVAFLIGPTQDGGARYYGWPTSLLYAVAPTVGAVRAGRLPLDLMSSFIEYDSFTEGVNDQEVLRHFEAATQDCDIVCASVTYDSLYPTLRLLRQLKQTRPQITTVLGGPHIDEVHSLEPFKTESMPPDIVDYAVAGDGEYALLSLLAKLTTGSDDSLLSGCPADVGSYHIYRHGHVVRREAGRLQLDAIPALPVEMADSHRRRDNLGRLLSCATFSPVVETIAHRGCPSLCKCCSERHGDINARSIEAIIEEIELRRKEGFRTVFFSDSTFGNYPWLPDLLDSLESTRMAFGCLNRFDKLNDRQLLERYRRAGFRYFYCAVEQFEDMVLQGIGKSENTILMRAAMQSLTECGFRVGIAVMYGLPYETDDSRRRTLDFIEEWVNAGTIGLVSQSILTFRPGTPFRKYLREGQGFNRVPPNRGYPFDRFEEGGWYHLPSVTVEDIAWIAEESSRRFRDVLSRQRGEAPPPQLP